MKTLVIAACSVLWLGTAIPAPDAESDAFTAAYGLKTKGQSAQAAAAFEAIAAAYPESPRLGEALVEAGVGWFAVGKSRQLLHRSNPQSDEAFGKAAELFARVSTDRKSDPAAGRAQYMLGSTALFQGDLAGAENAYGAVLEKFPGDPKYAPKALERRATVRRHLLQDDLALADLRLYLEKYPQGEETASVSRYIQFAAMNGKPAPALDAEVWVQGGPHSIDKLRGRVVGVYFFATWCEKCEAELPFLLDLERRLSPAGFVLVGVIDHNKGQTVESAKKYCGEHRIPFAVMMDKGSTMKAYSGQVIPELILIDREGRVRWHDHPASLSDYTIETLLGEESSSKAPGSPK
ncbi:MAG: redoxin family protein [Planctomycetota bacterium]